MLFVGRIQPLKGLDVAVETLARLANRRARLVVVGGASGNEGETEVVRIRSVIESLGVADRVDFVAPQAHHILSTYYRAADVVIVPSRSESFGLVALEAAACGVPVVASGVGGLITIVDEGVTGHLTADRSPDVFASHVDRILANPVYAAAMGARAAEKARRYTWSFSAARLRRAYADVTSRDRVVCR
jgi:D-inositol-3-phosphate glycosyltransferase